MDEQEFARRAGALFAEVEAALERAELDYEWITEGVLEIEFADGAKIVMNRHGPSQEIWIAARSGGFHFRWDGEDWRDTRDGAGLKSRLGALVSEQAGVDVRF
jgi:CyaY protein